MTRGTSPARWTSFYSYTGGKDKVGECHGFGHMEYDDGSFLAGA